MISESIYRALRPVTIVLGCCVICSFSMAQSAREEPPRAAPALPVPAEVAPIEERKLDQFAEAFIAIQEINAQTEQQLDEVETNAEAVVAEAEKRTFQAVKSSGLKLDEYHRIGQRTAVDGNLRDRLARKVVKRRRI
jgi:hypothetical protein